MPAKKVETEEQPNKTEEQLNRNVRFYARVKEVPKEAQKSFDNGRFSGTDINPMWRIQMLTELFGPCGFGWWTQNVKYEFVEADVTQPPSANNPTITKKETSVFCELELVIKDPETGEVSQPIYGVGGNTYIAWGKYGPRASDEAKKMAYTDALSIACKSLGFGHNVWYQNDKTKYTINDVSKNEAPKEEPKKTEEPFSDEAVEKINQIAEKLDAIGAKMKKDDKIAFAKDTIVPIIGSMNYKSCKDVKKLTALLDKLNAA